MQTKHDATALLKAIKDWCSEHESGYWILETMTDEDITIKFSSLREAKRFCELYKSISRFL